MCFPGFDEVSMACAGHTWQWGERSSGEHLVQPWQAVVRESFLVEVTSKLRCKAMTSETEESFQPGESKESRTRDKESRSYMWVDGTGRDPYQWKGSGSTSGVSACWRS